MKVKSLWYCILAAIVLTAIGIASIDLPPSGVIIYSFDQNPAGLDEGNEWVAIHNPTNKSVDIGNWTLVQRLCIFHLLSLIPWSKWEADYTPSSSLMLSPRPALFY